MTPTRSYGESCAMAHALDLVGERWAMLVVRELMLGPKRFTDLRAGVTHASPNVLSQRLRELEASGVVQRRTLAPPAATKVYELTDWGRELEPVIMALGRWGARSPLHDRSLAMSLDSHILALRTMFRPARAEGVAGLAVLHLGDDRFTLEVRDGVLRLERGEPDHPEAIVVAAPEVLLGVAFAGMTLDEAAETGGFTVSGDPRLVAALLNCFELPEPVTLA